MNDPEVSATLARAHEVWKRHRFEVLVVRPDHSFEFYERVGGHSIDHAIEAMDIGGVGAKVRVQAVGRVEVQ